MELYKLEKNIAVPSRGALIAGRQRVAYPFKQMEVGDSFFIKIVGDSRPKQKSVGVAACAWVRRRGNGFKFTTRAVSKGVRVWRVK